MTAINILVVAVSVTVVLILSIDAFDPNVFFMSNDLYGKIQLPVCIIYIAYFFFSMWKSPKRHRYFWRHLYILVLSIPYSLIFQLLPFHVHCPEPVTYAMHFLPASRAVLAMAFIVTFASKDRIFGIFISYSTILVLVVYFASLIFYIHESGPNPAVTDYWQALWFAFMDTTTLGASFYPVTTYGKAVAIICSGMGIVMLPIFTAYLTNAVKVYVSDSISKAHNRSKK